MNKITQEEFDSLSSVTPEEALGSVPEVPAATSEKNEEQSFSPKEFLNSKMGEHTPEDVFTGMFSIFFPRFNLLLNKLSNKQLRKLIKALIETPLNEKAQKSFDKATKEAFMIGDRLLIAKQSLIMSELSKEMASKMEVEQKQEKKEETNVGTP